MNIHDNVVKFKEERNFMSKLIIAAKSRPEIDVSKYLGEYEFSSVPKSLFSADGNLLKTIDKHFMLQELEKMFPWTHQIIYIQEKDYVLIFDGMAVANKINIQKYKLKTCQDFADVYSKIILSESHEFSEVCVLFDRYEELSLKSETRKHRTTWFKFNTKFLTTQISKTLPLQCITHSYEKRTAEISK